MASAFLYKIILLHGSFVNKFDTLESISVVTNDGKHIHGILKGFDQTTNIILDKSIEYKINDKGILTQHSLGLYIIRGSNIAFIGNIEQSIHSEFIEKWKKEPQHFYHPLHLVKHS